MRLATDTGGTFTDLVVEDDARRLRMYKSATTPDDPIRGVLDVVDVAAQDMRISRSDLLARSGYFIHGTTRAINAILTGGTARTAFLVTEGHPDILTLREGGRLNAFDFSQAYPAPYIPRSLTFEIAERIGQQGEIVRALDESAVCAVLETFPDLGVEAVAVCFLWSIANPAHERRVGELIEAHLPGMQYTLSHQLNPTLREYRRASSACLDASLKPLMGSYLHRLEAALRDAGFGGQVLVVTSSGGVLPARAVAEAPIHSVNSGPSMGPVSGRYYARVVARSDSVVVADTGGTSYDVSLVRRGRIPWTRETWLGRPYLGHMTGFPSVDVKSIGAGGGSVAWIDDGGMLHVGPRSAGSVPGPICYGQGGNEPTVTDACVVLGFIDPDYFLGGAMHLDRDAAVVGIQKVIGDQFGLDANEAAAAILRLATEHMVRAIEEITLHQGIDPRRATLVGGGGAAGLNLVPIARRLGCPKVVVPASGAVLSAVGALISDLTTEYAITRFTTDRDFDFDGVNRVLADLKTQCDSFAKSHEGYSLGSSVDLSVEAMYHHQIWELEVPLRVEHFVGKGDVEQLRQDFHDTHQEVFAIHDEASPVEFLTWRARVRCRLGDGAVGPIERATRRDGATTARLRTVYFPGVGAVATPIVHLGDLETGTTLEGPSIIESPLTTVVIDPGAAVEAAADGSLLIVPGGAHGAGG